MHPQDYARRRSSSRPSATISGDGGCRASDSGSRTNSFSTNERCWCALFVEAGIASFLWSGLPLVVAHLFVPGFVGGDSEPDFLGEREPRPVKGVWEGAGVFWYYLNVEGEDGAA